MFLAFNIFTFAVIRGNPKGEKADPGSLDPMDPGGSYWILMDPGGSSWILVDPRGS
jgi:hypothetical protein